MSTEIFKGNRKSRRAWVAAQKKHMRPGNLTHLQVKHDDFCELLAGGYFCNCNPTRVLKDDVGRILAVVENAGSYSPLEFLGSGQHD
jgi:hypothetical protein